VDSSFLIIPVVFRPASRIHRLSLIRDGGRHICPYLPATRQNVYSSFLAHPMQHRELNESPSPSCSSVDVMARDRAMSPASGTLQPSTSESVVKNQDHIFNAEDSDEHLEPPQKKQVLDNSTSSTNASQASVRFSFQLSYICAEARSGGETSIGHQLPLPLDRLLWIR
jgi:hypothetical protein